VAGDEVLTTFAPTIEAAPETIPTGNLWVSLPRIDRQTGAVHTLSVLHDGLAGMLELSGDDAGLIEPFVEVDGRRLLFECPAWERHQSWLPRLTAQCADGEIEALYCAPVDERGVTLRLRYRHAGTGPADVTVGWRVSWQRTSLTQLRAKPLDLRVESTRDDWTGSKVYAAGAGLPVVAIGVQSSGGNLRDETDHAGLAAASRTLADGDELVVDLWLAVAPERDGAAATALHLRRRGFDDLWQSTVAWLRRHELPVDVVDSRPGLHERVNAHAFFNYFFAQGDCLDTGRTVTVTSRSSDYYVSAAFWSRDAYVWTFPALLLIDPDRARDVLVTSIAAAGAQIANHALYINGTPLYPGFELDQAAAPIVAVALYVESTGDDSVLRDPAIARLIDGFDELITPWFSESLGLYATFLLPTDDPTRHPYTTTDNALVAVAFTAIARLLAHRASPGFPADIPAAGFESRAAALRQAIRAHLRSDGPYGSMWAWACDDDGATELRDEPPLSLVTLPFWVLCDPQDECQRATLRWLENDNPFRYAGRFAGTGSPHFPFPSGFDLANRLLTARDADADGDPLQQLVDTPMDNGLGCESWDPATGRVRTGAAMASMSGLLAWTAWSRLIDRSTWDQPLTRALDRG
jgi:hypothetical protein